MKRSELMEYYNISAQSVFSEEERTDLHKLLVKNNRYTETEMDSQWVDMHIDTSYTSEAANPHSHIFWEIIFCTRGDLPYLIGTERYQIQSGDVILVPPGVSHSMMPWNPESGVYQRYVLWCSQRMADWVTKQIRDDALFTGRSRVLRLNQIQQTHLLQQVKSGVRESNEKAAGWEVSLVGISLQIVSNLSRIASGQQAKPIAAHSDLLTKIIGYVQENLDGDLTVSAVSRHFAISESTLSHLFQKEMNLGFYRYVLQQRLTESKQLIFQGIPMESIAERVGFSAYSAYYRAFKKEYGISPSQYRQMVL